MNCKQGEMAFIVRCRVPKYAHALGWVVDVLYAAPSTAFRMPDGQLHDPAEAGHWVVKLPRLLEAPLSDARTRQALYGVIADCALRPIRAPGITTEEVNELYHPSPAKETV